MLLVLAAQLFLLHNTSQGESKKTDTHKEKTTLFDKSRVTQKSFPLSKIKKDAVLILTIYFPEGYHLIKDAGSSYSLTMKEQVLINGSIVSDETSIGIPTLPDNNSTLVLNLNYYYCTKKGVCHVQLSRWSIPVELRQDGSGKISITEIPDQAEKK